MQCFNHSYGAIFTIPCLIHELQTFSQTTLIQIQNIYVFPSCPYTFAALPWKTPSTKSCSMPSSARDSLAISYQSPTLEGPREEEDGDDPKIIRWYPKASITGPTMMASQRLIREADVKVDLRYILILRFHSFDCWVSAASTGLPGKGVCGVGASQEGGRNLTWTWGINDKAAT